MNPDYIWKLGLKIRKINIGAQKINSSALETFEIVIANFQVEDKASRPRFFQETFLVANIKFKVILGMLFLKISNANVLFGTRHSREGPISLIRPYLLSSKSKLMIQKNLL